MGFYSFDISNKTSAPLSCWNPSNANYHTKTLRTLEVKIVSWPIPLVSNITGFLFNLACPTGRESTIQLCFSTLGLEFPKNDQQSASGNMKHAGSMIIFYWGEYGNPWETTSNNFSSHPLHLWPRTKSQPLILAMTADQEILFCKPCRCLSPEVVVFWWSMSQI